MTQRELLLSLQAHDPEGWEDRQPTEQDIADFKRWVIETHGREVWQAYCSAWDTGWRDV